LWPAASPAARATDVSAEGFVRLAKEAADSGDTRELTDVTSIDGQPIDMAAILTGSRTVRQQRLESLAKITFVEQERLDGDALQTEAADITSHPPYTAKLADDTGVLARIGRFIADLFSQPGMDVLGFLVILAVAFLGGYLLLDRLVTRRYQAAPTSPSSAPAATDYQAQAEPAARTGDFAAAVRLLFMDGARWLEQLEVVRSAATTTTAAVRPLADDSRFLDRFDEIAYGGSDAGSDDVSGARRSWDVLKNKLRPR